ncbi:MAG: tetratricopeptide repeat protein [Nitrospirae bacterium]|nr:tetratricopeptide repeat protein [Nitrospirota bacterium]
MVNAEERNKDDDELNIKIKPIDSQASNKTGLLYKPIVHILLIAIVGLIAYSNTFHVPFHFDDKQNIVENPIIKDFQFFNELQKAKRPDIYDGFKNRFIGYLTFALNYRLHGLDVTGYHIVNLAIHLLNALLVYWLVLLTFKTPFFRVSECQKVRVSESQGFDTLMLGRFDTKFVALFSALIFVSHPIQTQAVTYIIQRLTSLSTLFYLLSLVMYVKWRLKTEGQGSSSKGQGKLVSCILYLASVLCAVLAMKTKEIAFTLPIIIVLYEFSFFSKSSIQPSTVNRQPSHIPHSAFRIPHLKRFLYLTPFLLTLLIIPVSYIGSAQSAGELLSNVSEATRLQTTISRWDYLFTQFGVIVTYISLLFLPINQNLDYDYPVYHSFFEPNVFLSFMFLLSIFGLAVYLFRRSRITAFGVFWFFIALSVESSVIPIEDVIFEHRIYLPSVGLFIAVVSAVFYLTAYFTKTRYLPLVTRFLSLLLVAIVIVFLVATYYRNSTWINGLYLWQDVVKKSPNKDRPHENLGVAYAEQNRFNKAINEYQTALRINPNFAEAHYDLGNTYLTLGRIEEAINEFEISVKLQPGFAFAHYHLGNFYYAQGRIAEAIREFHSMLKLKPDSIFAHNALGIIYLKQGNLMEATKEFETVLMLNPSSTEAQINLEILYNNLKSKHGLK